MTISSDSDLDGSGSSDTHFPSNQGELVKPSKVAYEGVFVAPKALPQRSQLSDSSYSRSGMVPEAQGMLNELDEKLVMLEVCCGCARLTYHCSKKGMKALGIDWSGCKDKPKGRVIWINLATSRGLAELKEQLEANKKTLKVVFMSPPYGTASGAREIRRNPDELGRVIDPKPLRSDEFPDGLPSLGGEALIKVGIANVLDANMVAVALWCD